jgi:hypothetical protein
VEVGRLLTNASPIREEPGPEIDVPYTQKPSEAAAEPLPVISHAG